MNRLVPGDLVIWNHDRVMFNDLYDIGIVVATNGNIQVRIFWTRLNDVKIVFNNKVIRK